MYGILKLSKKYPKSNGDGVGPSINTSGILTWLADNVVLLILAFIAIGLLSGARRNRMSDNSSVLLNVSIALFLFIGGAFLLQFVGGVGGLVFGDSAPAAPAAPTPQPGPAG